jgi:hypothetical protein
VARSSRSFEWVIRQGEDGTCDVLRDRRPERYGLPDADAALRWLTRDSRSTYYPGEPVYLEADGERERVVPPR